MAEPGPALPAWARGALEALPGGAGMDTDAVERRLAAAKAESEAMGVGMAILWRDMKRGLPVAARERLLPGAEALSAVERRRAQKALEDFWPSFWFANLWMNTVPWTPLVLPLVLKVGERFEGEKFRARVVPGQLDRDTERRLDWLMRRRERGGDEASAEGTEVKQDLVDGEKVSA